MIICLCFSASSEAASKPDEKMLIGENNQDFTKVNGASTAIENDVHKG